MKQIVTENSFEPAGADPGTKVSGSRCVFLAALVAASTLLGGCVLPYRAMPLEDGVQAHSRPFQQARHGVILAADLFDQEAETRARFFHSLRNRNIVAVVLHLENAGNRTMVLRRDRISLRVEGEPEPLQTLDPELVVAECRRSNALSYLGLPLVAPYLVARQEIAQFNFELDRDYRSKSLPAYLRFAPGDPPGARALFFRADDGTFDKLRRSPVLEIHAEVEAGTGNASQPGQDVHYLLSLG